MSTTAFKILWEKYHAGTLQPEENELFESLLLTLTEEEISAIIDENIDVDMQAPFAKEAVFDQIVERIGHKQTRLIPIWTRYAAAVLLLIASSIFFLREQLVSDKQNTVTAQRSNDILLSLDRHATLTLQDGSSFSVNDSMPELETVAVRIKPIEKGVYAFEVKEDPGQKEEYYVFETPKGVSNQLILSDGTKVWLNAASRLEVSSQYDKGAARKIRLQGEAYFEVAHNKARPFYVNTKETTVKVLGTSFNIRSRSNKALVETSLAQGRVLVTQHNKEVVLAPGEQGITVVGSSTIVKNKVDIGQILAWKTGYFEFVDAPIADILEELADWYDIDKIEWQKNPSDRITVSLARTRSLSELLNKLELITNAHFTIKERRIVVN